MTKQGAPRLPPPRRPFPPSPASPPPLPSPAAPTAGALSMGSRLQSVAAERASGASAGLAGLGPELVDALGGAGLGQLGLERLSGLLAQRLEVGCLGAGHR